MTKIKYCPPLEPPDFCLLSSIHISVLNVEDALMKLDVNKSSAPDLLSPKLLKKDYRFCLNYTLFFLTLALTLVALHPNGRKGILHLFIRKMIEHNLLIIGQ